ncbi:MAG: DUF6624 domain-containing protein [Bacteroidota bacterium]
MIRNILLLFLLVSIFSNCQPKEPNFIPEGLTKLSRQEIVDRARVGNFPNMDELTYMNMQGKIITRDSLSRIEDFAEIAFDDYVDEQGVVRVTIMRKATAEDKIWQQKMMQAMDEGPELQPVAVDCSQIGPLLDSVLVADQKNRAGEKELDLLVDARNQEIVISILEQCGMPTTKEVNRSQVEAVWLVIQHGRIKYQKKYLPLFKIAAEAGDLDLKRILMMEDRILVGEGKPQIYGTQLERNSTTGEYELSETVEPEYLNQRRAAVGFEPMEEYLLNFGMEFNIPQKEK